MCPELIFDATGVEPSTGEFEPMPAGEYLAIMVNSEMKDTKNGNGSYLECTWEVVDGEHKNRKLFDRLNLANKNDTAVRIAQSTLSAICHSVGVLRVKSSEELHNKPCLLKVSLEPRDDKPGAFSNRIKKYMAPGSKTTSEKTTSSTPPWKKAA